MAHPNIVLCMGIAVTPLGELALVTEYAENGSLYHQLYDVGRKFSVREGQKIAEGLLKALAYLHGQGYYHCDIKSSNVLLDSSWNIKLCDFGLSRSQAKSFSGKIGTSSWMAP